GLHSPPRLTEDCALTSRKPYGFQHLRLLVSPKAKPHRGTVRQSPTGKVIRSTGRSPAGAPSPASRARCPRPRNRSPSPHPPHPRTTSRRRRNSRPYGSSNRRCPPTEPEESTESGCVAWLPCL